MGEIFIGAIAASFLTTVFLFAGIKLEALNAFQGMAYIASAVCALIAFFLWMIFWKRLLSD